MNRFRNYADTSVAAVAQEIARYLANHPSAADSAEGIRRWWLMRQRYEESATTVQRALEQLLREGVVTRHVLSDGSVLYRGQPRAAHKQP